MWGYVIDSSGFTYFCILRCKFHIFALFWSLLTLNHWCEYLIFWIHICSYFLPLLCFSMGFYCKICSDGCLPDCMSPVTQLFWLSYSCLNIVVTQSLLHSVIQILEEKCLANRKKVWVTLKVKVIVQLEVTTTQNILRQNGKTKKFTPLQVLLRHFEHNMNYQNLLLCPDF